MKLIIFLFTCYSILQANDRPNIVFLLADDMGYGDLGCYGNPVIKSPNIDKLASNGVKLLNCYSASPNCSPARAGILTGRSPYRVGMYDFARFPDLHIPSDEVTIAEVLKDAGYATMFAGKWHCSGKFPGPKQPDPGMQGFDHWLANKTNFGPNPTTFFRNGKATGEIKGWMAELVVNEAMDWISQHDKKQPFMTMLWFSEPHTPVKAAPEFIELYENPESEQAAQGLKFGGTQVIRKKAKEQVKNHYFACVSQLDHHVGRLMTYLEENNLTKNTLIIFTSDNGPEHRTSTAFGSPGELRGAKGHIHEGGFKVPGIISWPGKIKANTESQEPLNGTDFLPTLAGVAKAKLNIQKTLDGCNVMPAILGTGKTQRETPMLWWLYHSRGGKEIAMRLGDYKILANMLPQAKVGDIGDAKPPSGMSIMDFIKKADLGNFSLYNLKNDPNEKNNLAQSEPEKLANLKKIMIKLHADIRAEGPVYQLGGKKKK